MCVEYPITIRIVFFIIVSATTDFYSIDYTLTLLYSLAIWLSGVECSGLEWSGLEWSGVE